MSEYREKRTVVEGLPVEDRAVVETRYDSVTTTRRRISGVAVAALVVAAVTAAIVITMMIGSNQQRNRDELALERARTADAQQTPAQPAPQLPIIVNMPQSLPATVAVPYPVPGAPPVYARTAPSNASVEIDVTSRLQNDELLRPYAINVKVDGGTATLTGNVADADLKMRAQKLAGAVNAVNRVINEIDVRP